MYTTLDLQCKSCGAEDNRFINVKMPFDGTEELEPCKECGHTFFKRLFITAPNLDVSQGTRKTQLELAQGKEVRKLRESKMQEIRTGGRPETRNQPPPKL